MKIFRILSIFRKEQRLQQCIYKFLRKSILGCLMWVGEKILPCSCFQLAINMLFDVLQIIRPFVQSKAYYFVLLNTSLPTLLMCYLSENHQHSLTVRLLSFLQSLLLPKIIVLKQRIDSSISIEEYDGNKSQVCSPATFLARYQDF